MRTKASQEIELRANPYTVFEHDDSSISLHARRRWMNGARLAEERSRELAGEISASQQADGSWDERTSRSIQSMYALWLLGGAPKETIDRGIDWLTQVGQPVLTHKHYYGMFFRIPNEKVAPLHNMDDTPFTPGCTGIIKSGAAMFLACEYGRQDEDHIALAFESARKLPADPGNDGRWCSPGCGENLFHAFAVLPEAERQRGRAALSELPDEATATVWSFRQPDSLLPCRLEPFEVAAEICAGAVRACGARSSIRMRWNAACESLGRSQFHR